MKISEHWLHEWAALKLDAVKLGAQMTMAGLEVGSIQPAAPKLDNVVVGKIRSAAPHPSADKLQFCEVEIGKGKVLSIVCGAANARAGMFVPVALPGAVLPNGVEIKEAEVRGARSAGMLCSASELGLEESSEGLLDLGSQVKIGTSISDALELDDRVLEVELTPNRGDCLSVRGLAREVSTLTGAKFTGPRLRKAKVASRKRFDVKLEAAGDCPRYAGRVVENIKPDAVTPLWMSERLRRAGVRSIHPVVDVTNYVMLELGQPMHAFDLDKLQGSIVVRHARAKESVALLDGSTREVEKGTLLIADKRGAVALAGVMGGSESAVGDATKHIFLESAYFAPDAIAGRARALGMHTESSHRFERGVDPALQRDALERATELLLKIVGGRAGPVVERSIVKYLPKKSPIVLRDERIELILGITLAPKEISKILSGLGMRVTRSGKTFRVLPPSWRFDVTREVDLIEELARVHGYDKLPTTRPRIEMIAPPAPEGRVTEVRLRAALVDRDYQEVITYSFVDPKLQSMLHPDVAPLALANPISADMAVMRTSMWSGLVQTVLYNQNRQQTRLRLFELGLCFIPSPAGLAQEPRLGAALVGSVAGEQWGLPAREVDFFDAKADVEALLTLTGRRAEFEFRPAANPVLHPGRSADIVQGGAWVGSIGQLHPDIQTKLGIDRPVILFELMVSALIDAQIPRFREISRFPALRRDLAVVVADATSAQTVLNIVSKVAGNLLVNLQLFDEYHGKGIDSGRKSLALALTLQDSSRTLKDDEVDAVIVRIVSALQTELGAELRS
jgi:phenylalanyl-tRNA synthetase beta chain